ncbi:MAG: hypothetical protein OIF48_20285 [Silicimonas sp.]|nr:hypothetical protein [Silicimonas sp.]
MPHTIPHKAKMVAAEKNKLGSLVIEIPPNQLMCSTQSEGPQARGATAGPSTGRSGQQENPSELPGKTDVTKRLRIRRICANAATWRSCNVVVDFQAVHHRKQVGQQRDCELNKGE